MLAVHLGWQIGTDHGRIARRRCCDWVLLRLTRVQIRIPNWETEWTNMLIIRCIACEVQIVEYGRIGGAFVRPNWNRSLVNRTSSFLRPVVVAIDVVAQPKAKRGNQMY